MQNIILISEFCKSERLFLICIWNNAEVRCLKFNPLVVRNPLWSMLQEAGGGGRRIWKYELCPARLGHEPGSEMLNAEENVDEKMNLYFYLESCEWLDVFAVSYSGTPQLQQNACEQRWVSNENLNNLPFGFPFSGQANFCDFKLFLCRARPRSVRGFKTHLLRYFSVP